MNKAQETERKRAQKTQVAKGDLYNFNQDFVNKLKIAEQRSGAAAPSHVGKWRPGPDHEWDNAGQKSGLQIWRIEKFSVVPWPVPQYGQFYDGDSYIVLKTVINGSVKKWDIHFWLGEKTSQDEAGTAAYKSVELDDKLGGAPIQHREVQGFESALFLSYFKPSIFILQGGVDSGFTHVGEKEYKPRLLHVKGKRTVRVEQVPLHSSSLNSGDVFVLDAGLKIYVWQGEKSSPQERLKGGEIARAIRDEREAGATVHILSESGADAEKANFWSALGGEGPVASASEGGDDFEHEAQGVKRLLRLSDASGTLAFTEVASGKIAKNLLDTNDVFILDSGSEVFTWIGKKASASERSKALQFAQQYLTKYNRPPYLSICKVLEGGENEVFNTAFD